MFYKVDFIRLAVQMLPPLLRGRLMVALLRVITLPLRQMYELFIVLRNSTKSRLETTGNVESLERALNAAFFLTERQIYIKTPPREIRATFYLSSEEQRPTILYMAAEGGAYMMQMMDENRMGVNFMVMVPTFLCTSTECRDADRYFWRHYIVIKTILDIYKPAGRTFGIELYDYE